MKDNNPIEFKINDDVGIRNAKDELIPLGHYGGIYWSEKHQNKDFALVRLPNSELEKLKREINLLKLEWITASLILVPIKLLETCEVKKKK